MTYCVNQRDLDLSRHEIVGGPWPNGCQDCGSSSSGSSDSSSSSSSSSSVTFDCGGYRCVNGHCAFELTGCPTPEGYYSTPEACAANCGASSSNNTSSSNSSGAICGGYTCINNQCTFVWTTCPLPTGYYATTQACAFDCGQSMFECYQRTENGICSPYAIGYGTCAERGLYNSEEECLAAQTSSTSSGGNSGSGSSDAPANSSGSSGAEENSSGSSGGLEISSASSGALALSSTSSAAVNNYTVSGSIALATQFAGEENCAGASIAATTNTWLPFAGVFPNVGTYNYGCSYGPTVARQNSGSSGPQIEISGAGGLDAFGFPTSLSVTVHYGSSNAAPNCMCPNSTDWSATVVVPRTAYLSGTMTASYALAQDLCVANPAVVQGNFVQALFMINREVIG